MSAVRDAYRHESRAESAEEQQPVSAHSSVYTPESKIMAITNTAHRLFTKVVRDAETAPLREIALPEQSRPPLLQWGIPLILLVAMTAAKTVAMDWV